MSPIKKENKQRYPKNWKEIRLRIQERAANKCEWCGIPNYAYVNRFTRELNLKDEPDTIRIICTTAHLNHLPEDCRDENLAFLCQKCHNNYDMPHRKETRKLKNMKGQLKWT